MTLRICSLLPSATEIVYALGLGDDLVAVTHECDHPAAAREKPAITASLLPGLDAPPGEIDAEVRRLVEAGEGIYRIDADLLRRLEPDLVLTQKLCEVCAVNYDDVLSVARTLPRPPDVVNLEPTRLEEVLGTILEVGRRAGREARAEEVVAALRERLARVANAVAGTANPPRTLALEWLDPPMVGGHWVPEMIRMAGGEDVLGEAGRPSRGVEWSEIAAAAPEVVVLMPCGYDLDRAARSLEEAFLPLEWEGLPAVAAGRVHATDANAFFSRPGPRLVDGVEILAHVLHPERHAGPPPAGHRRLAP